MGGRSKTIPSVADEITGQWFGPDSPRRLDSIRHLRLRPVVLPRPTLAALCIAGSLLMGSSGLSIRLMAEAQTLAWQFPTNRTVLQIDRPYPLAATASSGLPVTFRVVGGPASIQGGSLIVTNVGTVHLQASQPGTATHDPVSETRVINQVAVSLSLEVDRPTAPRSSRALHVHQGRVYVAQGSDGLEILDADPQSGLTRLGVFNTPGMAQDIQVDAGLAYLADGPAGVAILNVTDPGNPIGSNSGPPNYGICLAEQHLLTADGTAGMRIEPRNSGTGRGHFQTIGTCYDIRTSANLAFLAEGYGLQIVDISNPAAPVALGRYITPGNNTSGLHVQGDLVYLAGQTLTIVDVSNPSEPHLVGSFPEGGTRVDLMGSLAMVVSNQGLQVVDVSAPASPVLVGSKAIDGGVSDVQVVGDLVYLACAKVGVQVYRVRQSTPQEMTFTPPQHATPADSPIRLSAAVSSGLPVTYRVLSGPATLTGDDLVLNGEGTVEILAEQAGAGVITPVSVARSIVVRRRTQTITWSMMQTESLLLLDQPYPMSATSSSGLPVTLRVAQGPAYLSGGQVIATNAGVVLINAEQAGDGRHAPVVESRIFNPPARPTRTGIHNTSGTSYSVAVVGDRAFVADGEAGVQILDVSNPASAVHLGGFNTSGTAFNLQVEGHWAYVADGDAGLAILDIRNASAPVLVGTLNTGRRVNAVQVSGNYAYLATGGSAIIDGGLDIVDIRNPAVPVRIGRFATFDGAALGLHVTNEMAFLAKSDAGLVILDVSNPTGPALRGQIAGLGSARHVRVVGSLAYLACGTGGLNIVDVANPSSPARLGSWRGRNLQSVEVDGMLAYATSLDLGLHVIAVSSPTRPALVQHYLTGGPARNLYLRGNSVLVAASQAGLESINLVQQMQPTLDFNLPARAYLDGSPLTLESSSNSGLPITFHLVSGPGAIVGDRLLLSGTGTLVIRAELTGNRQFLPAKLERSLPVYHPLVLSLPRMDAGEWVISWSGGNPPFNLFKRGLLEEPAFWIGSTDERTIRITVSEDSAWFQVSDSP